jgi:hypothetical protein
MRVAFHRDKSAVQVRPSVTCPQKGANPEALQDFNF